MTGEARFCPRCGTRRSGYFRFCAECAFDFDELLSVASLRPADPGASAPTRSVLARPIMLPVGAVVAAVAPRGAVAEPPSTTPPSPASSGQAGTPAVPALKERPPAAAPAGGVAGAATAAATAVAVAPPQAAPRPAVWPPPGAVPTEELQRRVVAPLPPPKFRPDLVDVSAPAAVAASTAAAAPIAAPTTRVSPRVRSILARRPDLTLTRVAIVALFGLLAFSAITNLVRTTAGSPKVEPSTAIGSPLDGGVPGSQGLPPEPSFRPTGPTEFATVSDVIDGDTIRVVINGTEYPLRYIGMDTPEPDATDPTIKRFADLATAANSSMVAGQDVYLEKEESETDQFDRLLRNVWLVDDNSDWVMVNLSLVRLGYGQVSTFPPDVRYVDDLVAAQEEAQHEGVGMWAPVTAGNPSSSPAASLPSPAAALPSPSVHEHGSAACHPSYDPCLPIVPDLDCAEVRAIGAAPVTVKGPDDYELDPAEDGLGCEPDE
jgi:endonuclease YncB( thermonuclease family)